MQQFLNCIHKKIFKPHVNLNYKFVDRIDFTFFLTIFDTKLKLVFMIYFAV